MERFEGIILPAPKFSEFVSRGNLMAITENSRLTFTVIYNQKEYAPCGFMSSGEHGYYYVEAYEVVDLPRYTGQLKPLKYGPHFNEVRQDKRERSYNGLLLKYGDREVVLTGKKQRFLPSTEGKQITIF